MTARWYAIQLIPQLLETAAVNLKRQDFPYFFPRVEIRLNRKTTITEPMFRGYGFVQLDIEVRWLAVNGTKGVIGLLPRHARLPLPLPAGFVECLQAADPMKEEDFFVTFDQYFPGVTEVEINHSHELLGGRKGLVTDIRSRLLQVSVYMTTGSGRGVWLDRDQVSPVKKD